MGSTNNFKEYLKNFEEKIIIGGFKKGLYTKRRKVSTKDCRLTHTDFGAFLGKEVEYPVPLVADYYGYIKRSKGLNQLICGSGDIEIKSIKVPIIYFNSVKIEEIDTLAPELSGGFIRFKKYLVELRDFK